MYSRKKNEITNFKDTLNKKGKLKKIVSLTIPATYQRLIYEALLKYFPKSVKGVDPPPPQRSPSALPESSAAPAQQPLTS